MSIKLIVAEKFRQNTDMSQQASFNMFKYNGHKKGGRALVWVIHY